MSKLKTIFKTIRTGQIFYFPPHLYYRLKRDIQIQRTTAISTEKEWSKGVLEVHFLTGSRQVVDFLFAAKSLVVNYSGPVLMYVHGDSSITNSDLVRIKKHFPNAIVTDRAARDKIVEPELRKRKLNKCLLFRNVNVFATKLIDLCFVSRGEGYLYIDTDCLSFRPLVSFRTFVTSDDPRSMIARDCGYSYCLKPDEIQMHFKISEMPSLNAGLYLAARGAIDLECVERWLSAPGFDMKSHFAEQTILAALLVRAGVDILDEKEYDVGRRFGENVAALVHYCGHYLSATRIAMRRVGHKDVLRQLRNHSVGRESKSKAAPKTR